MADKKVQWGRKADQDEVGPDPNEFVFGKQAVEAGEGATPATGDVRGDAGQPDSPGPPEQEPRVRITVDVRKSIHKELQRVCNARELKIAQLIRQLIDRELRRSKNRQ